MPKQADNSQIVSDILVKRQNMSDAMSEFRANMAIAQEFINGDDIKDEAGNVIYNHKIEEQFIDSFVSRYTERPTLEIISGDPSANMKKELVKVLFANAWAEGDMTVNQATHIRQAASFGLSVVYVGSRLVNDLVKKEIVTGVDENGEEIKEEIEYRDQKNVRYLEPVDMRNFYCYEYATFKEVSECIWEKWIDEAEFSQLKENNAFFNLENCKPVIRNLGDDTFRYPNEQEGTLARWYKLTQYFKEPDGSSEGDKLQIVCNDAELIYDGMLPNESLGNRRKQLPFSMLPFKKIGTGFFSSVGIPALISGCATEYNRALHLYRIGTAMASIGFMTANNSTLANPKDKITQGAILGFEGVSDPQWNHAPYPDGGLLEVANRAYDDAVRILGFDPRQVNASQPTTTAYQKASEDKAQAERMKLYSAQIEAGICRQSELIIADIVQNDSKIDIDATRKNFELPKGNKNFAKPVYKKVTIEGDSEPQFNKDGKVIGLKPKKGAGATTIELTPDLLDFSGKISVRTSTNRPLYELTDRQAQNEYIGTVLLPMIAQSELLKSQGFDVGALITDSMQKNGIVLPRKEKTREEVIGNVQARYRQLPNMAQVIQKENAISNIASGLPTPEAA